MWFLAWQNHYKSKDFSIISARQLRGNACDLQKKQKTRYVFSAFLFLN